MIRMMRAVAFQATALGVGLTAVFLFLMVVGALMDLAVWGRLLDSTVFCARGAALSLAGVVLAQGVAFVAWLLERGED